MSRVPVWCEIVCGRCAKPIAGEFTYGALPRKSLVARAKKYGWILKHNEVFCSGVCLTKFERDLGN